MAAGSTYPTARCILSTENYAQLNSAAQRRPRSPAGTAAAAAVRHPTMSTPVLSLEATTVAAYYVVSICIALLKTEGYDD